MGGTADILPTKDAEELIDFTCASPWERLALDIELELRAWGLHDGQQPSDEIVGGTRPVTSQSSGGSAIEPQPITCSQISLGTKVLSLELRVSPPGDSLDSHPLERLLGVNQCVMLTAATPDGIAADDGSDAAVLLSAMSVAASACSCPVPMLVPVGRPSSLRFIGRQLYPAHLRFSCDYTHQLSSDYSHLAGLLSLFRNKRTSARRLSSPSTSDAKIEAKFTYDWNDFSFKLAPSPGTFASDRRLSAVQTAALAQSDPVSRIRVTAVWDEFPATDLQRNETLAGMPASTANRLRLSPSHDLLRAITSSSIPTQRIPMTAPARANLRLAEEASNLQQRTSAAAPLAVIDVRKRPRNASADPLSERSPRGSQMREPHSDSPRVGRSPSPTALDEYLRQVGQYVAAAAIQDERIDEEFLTSAVAALFEMDLGRGIMVDVVDALGPNAAEMTLLERVSRLMATSETVNAAQKLWSLFLDGIEVHWEQQWIICGVPFSTESGPDHDESLMMQKLQMVNCCIERSSRARAATRSDSMGRKRRLPGVTLVGDGDPGESADSEGGEVWEPYVQSHPLVTRDMVEEELKRMVMRAENKDQSDELEAKRQSRTLKSDMMAFKAANPKASMADFVRWFSPSDWIEEDNRKDAAKESKSGIQVDASISIPEKPFSSATQETEGKRLRRQSQRGRLSARMSRKDNIWEELWNEAEPLAVADQEPLCDADAHGSKALADLRTMTMTQVLLHLCIIQGSSTTMLLNHALCRPPPLSAVRLSIERAKHEMRSMCAGLGLAGAEAEDLGRVSAALEAVIVAEHTCLIAASVLTKLPPADGMGPIVDRLACGQWADVDQEQEKRLVTRMAGLDDGGWRNVLLPEWREFVVRGSGGDRMYARLSREEFRVAFRLGLEYAV